jgi:hypothetical protein
MRSTAMVFRGCGQVLSAYAANDMPSWAICNGKDIMFASEESDMAEGEASLREALDMIKKGGSKAIFTLRVYELEGKMKILSNTPYPRAIPFTVFDDEEDLAPYDQRRRGYMQEVENRLREQDAKILELKARLAEAEEEEEDDRSPVDRFIAGIVEDPMAKQIFLGALQGIVSKIVPMRNQNGPAAVAGIGEVQSEAEPQTLSSVLESGQPEKVQQAINLLCCKDPKLGDHLLALAQIAMNDPGKYNFALSFLK